MSVQIKSSSSFQTQEQFVEVSTMEQGGVMLTMGLVDDVGESYNPTLYLTKQQAMALSIMLQDISNRAK